jgi:hypothetical protein
MKTLPRLFILLFILLAAQQSTFLQVADAVKERGNLADLPLRAVSIKRSNVPLALHDIADKYNIPIGVEISPDDDLLKERKILVQFDSGTLKDALNSVVSQNPLYTWNIEDDVVNVFPKNNREPLLKALLEARIETISIPPGTSRFSFRESLIKSPELKGILASFGVESNNEVFLSRDIAALGRGFSLSLSDVTVKSILNRVIRESETKYWIINRDGPHRQYVLLNL